MKNLAKNLVINSILAAGLLLAVSCEKNFLPETGDEFNSVNDESSYLKNTSGNFQSTEIQFVDTEDLNETELEMLTYMVEEEKLARDVYYALYDVWGSKVFDNISKAEEQHISAIVNLLSFYGIESVPVLPQGEYVDQHFKTLYDELVDMGSASLEEAFKVGALIEELDIKDLSDDLLKTENENIILVFNNLIKGSENHLRAFNNQLVLAGITYTPQYLTVEEFNAIIEAENDNKQQKKGIKNQASKNSANGNGNQQNANGNNSQNGDCTVDPSGDQNQNQGSNNNGNSQQNGNNNQNKGQKNG